ncbi:MAG: hypothetical protein ACE5IR_24175 [bacterium]
MSNFLKRTLFISLFLSSFFIMTFMRCSFQKPSAPSWDVEVAIPLISKVYTMADIAEDESSLSLDSTGTLNFEAEADLDNHYVGDQLNIKDLQKSFQLSLGSFNVNSPGVEQSNIELREIYPPSDNFDGLTVTVPTFSFTTSKVALDAYEDFSYVKIDTGTLNIRIENNLPIPLGSPVTLQIWDFTADTVIATKTRTVQINPNDSRRFLVNLKDKTFSNHLSVRVFGESPGSEGVPVLVDAGAMFQVRATIGDLKVSEARAKIPEQEVRNEDNVVIDEPLEIHEAHIENCLVRLELNGSMPVDAQIIYSLPDFISQAGVAFVDSFFIAKNTNTNIDLDLSPYILRPLQSGVGTQTIRFVWTARTVDTGLEQVLIKSSDFVDASLNISELSLSKITGRIGEKEIDISESEIEFDIPVDLDSVFFETATMELLINNGINFPATLSVRIEGENQAGRISQMFIDETIQPATEPGVPKTSRIVLNHQNSNIQDFISILPSHIRVFGSARLGSGNWVGTVTKDDFINGSVRITAPFALKLTPQIIDSDINEVEIDDDVQRDIEDNLSSGTFYIEISNHLPLGADVEFIFAQDSSQVFQNPILQIGPIETAAAILDSAAYVLRAQDSNITIALTEEKMRTFLKSPLFAAVRVTTQGTDGQFVKVRGSDYIQIKSYGKIKMKVNQN